ncbi:8365_t:CDS:2, partial [Funneliformis geosporum]
MTVQGFNIQGSGNILKGASVANNTAETVVSHESDNAEIDSEEENINTSKFKEKSTQSKEDKELEELLKK